MRESIIAWLDTASDTQLRAIYLFVQALTSH